MLWNRKGRKKSGTISLDDDALLMKKNIEPDIPSMARRKRQPNKIPNRVATVKSKSNAWRAWNFTKRDLSFCNAHTINAAIYC